MSQLTPQDIARDLYHEEMRLQGLDYCFICDAYKSDEEVQSGVCLLHRCNLIDCDGLLVDLTKDGYSCDLCHSIHIFNPETNEMEVW